MQNENKISKISRRQLIKTAAASAVIMGSPAFIRNLHADDPIKIGVL